MIRLILLILFPLLTQAQKMPETGEVLADSKFICADPFFMDSTTYGLEDLCRSKNSIEIRLMESSMATTIITILSYDNKEWKIEKYFPEYIEKRKKVVAIIPRKITVTDSAGRLGILFDSLRSRHIFTIPDFKELMARAKKQGTGFGAVSDGVLYSISYKVGTNFRRYWYDNPLYYAGTNPEFTEFKDITRIVELMDSFFY